MKYKTIKIIELFAGQIGLSAKQAQARPGKLKKIKDGLYEIVSPVQFKAGEVIELNNPDKIILSKLECLEEPAPKKKPAKKAKAKKK